MTDQPKTRASLLVRLRDARDHQSWEHFVRLYAPLIYRYARNHHLQDADAADLTQEVLQTVSKSIGRLEYDPELGSFRGWLFTIVRRRLCDFFDRKKRQVECESDSNLERLLQENTTPQEDLWDREYQKQLLHWAAETVRPSFAPTTWAAFHETALEGRPVAEVAADLGLSIGAVYIARTRVQGKLKEVIESAQID